MGADVVSKSFLKSEGRIDNFLNGLEELLDGLDGDSFENYKSVLMAKLLEKDPSLTYESNRLWNQIVDKRYIFDFSKKEADELGNITKHNVIEWYKTYFKPPSPIDRYEVVKAIDPQKAEILQRLVLPSYKLLSIMLVTCLSFLCCFSKFFSVAKSFMPTDDRFKVIKKYMKQTLKNFNMKPLSHSTYLRLQVLCKSFYDVDEKLHYVNDLCLDDLKAFIPGLLSQSSLQIVVSSESQLLGEDIFSNLRACAGYSWQILAAKFAV
ncbi:hypothetical protein VNO80_21188 [Phaseolus coccineus]|uniref:Uncharacterized protein n=1 Tax=Phaseolus coccineus TaxID=3886 RepID=A0AAN9M1Z7_PHACN